MNYGRGYFQPSQESTLALDLLKGGGFDLGKLGFDEDEISLIRKKAGPPDEFGKIGHDIDVQHVCPKCGYEWSGKSKEDGEGEGD